MCRFHSGLVLQYSMDRDGGWTESSALTDRIEVATVSWGAAACFAGCCLDVSFLVDMAPVSASLRVVWRRA